MRVLIDILHPAHVHFFRNFISMMQSQGHEVRLLSRKKDVTTDLLDAYGLPHKVISSQQAGRVKLASELVKRIIETRRVIRSFQPDILLGLMGPSICIAGKMEGVRTVVFYDNETTHRLNQTVAKFADAWISPRGFKHQYGANHIRYDGYHELAYLHPNYFTPEPARMQTHGINPSEPYSILRFVAWESIHDVGETGFNLEGKREAIKTLSNIGPVYISSEKALPTEFEPYRLNLPVEDVHHALACASLVVGESSTMASEAACLGTHAVFVSRSGRGVNDEQEELYGLVKTFNGDRQNDALTYLHQLTKSNPATLKSIAQKRQSIMLEDTIDVTAFLINYVNAACRESAQVAA